MHPAKSHQIHLPVHHHGGHHICPQVVLQERLVMHPAKFHQIHLPVHHHGGHHIGPQEVLQERLVMHPAKPHTATRVVATAATMMKSTAVGTNGIITHTESVEYAYFGHELLSTSCNNLGGIINRVLTGNCEIQLNGSCKSILCLRLRVFGILWCLGLWNLSLWCIGFFLGFCQLLSFSWASLWHFQLELQTLLASWKLSL